MNELLELTEGSGSNISFVPAATGSQQSVLATFGLMALLAFAAPTPSTGGGEIHLGASPTSVISVVEPRRRAIPVRSVARNGERRHGEETAAQLLALRQRFSLTMQQLADIVGVTRQVIYRWSDGRATPRPRHSERLSRLSALVAHFVRAGGSSLGVALMLPEPGEPQLLALLRREKLPHRSIEEALSTIARRQARIGALYSIDEDLRRAGMAPGPIDDRATEREDSRIATRTSRRDG